jgi:hypothetical protein
MKHPCFVNTGLHMRCMGISCSGYFLSTVKVMKNYRFYNYEIHVR